MDNLSYLNSLGFNLTAKDLVDNSHKRVIVGMSGGVDSSVTAALLHLMGYHVVGIFMKNWNKCQSDDYEDAVRVCCIMGIKNYYHLDLSDDYYSLVFNRFLDDLKTGLTPNPDILCNKHIKFDIFYNLLDLYDADFLATGHYAKIVNGKLSRPVDSSKDQSYFLHAVNNSVWSRVLFPLGNLTKTMVRKIARDLKLPVSDKKDSTGICFIGNKNYRNFIKDYISSCGGDIITTDGRKLGVHSGLFNFTVGQTRGLGIDYHKKVMVVRKDSHLNNLIVAEIDSDICFTNMITVRDFTAGVSGDCLVRFSNLGTLYPATVINSTIILASKIRLIAPGQAAVFYNSDGVVLGGATVT